MVLIIVISLFDCFAASISMYRNSFSDWVMAAEQVQVNRRPPGLTRDIAKLFILVYLKGSKKKGRKKMKKREYEK